MIRNCLLIVGITLASLARAAEPTAEARVAELVKQPNVTVVHLWATWCPNCYMEIKDGGWKKFVEANPNAQIVFASVWDDGKDGHDLLEKFGVGAQKNVTIVADPGSRRGDDKLKRFLDYPVTWLPSTWIFKNGKLYYALNYGEIHFDVLQKLVDDSTSNWDRKASEVMK
jgi:thiol-disulfide isomerase/thioredoxin